MTSVPPEAPPLNGVGPDSASAFPTDEELGITQLNTIDPIEVRWLWQDKIPLGKPSALVGPTSQGKTFVCCDMAARVSTGAGWPDAPDEDREPGDVFIMSAEDDLADTIVPRLRAHGADLDRIRSMGTAVRKGRADPFTIAQIDRLQAAIGRYPRTRLIILDPVTAFLGRGVDDNKQSDLRGLLGPLSELSARHGVAVVLVTHYPKNSKSKAIDRVIGSVAYANAPRAVLTVIPDPGDEDRRLFLPLKNNLSPERSGLAFRIVDGRVTWEDRSIDVRADEVFGDDPRPAGRRSKIPEAKVWLENTLQVFGRIPSERIYEMARERGFGRDVLNTAKRELGVQPRQDRLGEPWYWFLATSDDPTLVISHSQ